MRVRVKGIDQGGSGKPLWRVDLDGVREALGQVVGVGNSHVVREAGAEDQDRSFEVRAVEEVAHVEAGALLGKVGLVGVGKRGKARGPCQLTYVKISDSVSLVSGMVDSQCVPFQNVY